MDRTTKHRDKLISYLTPRWQRTGPLPLTRMSVVKSRLLVLILSILNRGRQRSLLRPLLNWSNYYMIYTEIVTVYILQIWVRRHCFKVFDPSNIFCLNKEFKTRTLSGSTSVQTMDHSKTKDWVPTMEERNRRVPPPLFLTGSPEKPFPWHN